MITVELTEQEAAVVKGAVLMLGCAVHQPMNPTGIIQSAVATGVVRRSGFTEDQFLALDDKFQVDATAMFTEEAK